jgi:enoyl-CoA hydratase/carnithine racemase
MAVPQEQSELVLSEIADGIATLTLNRPERANAWTVPLETRYFDLLRECERDPEVRVIILTGAGRHFCPGMDAQALDDIAAGTTGLPSRDRKPSTYPSTIGKPIIAAINGACAGFGLMQALVCDIRFAAEGVNFSMAFPRRGIMAEHGTAWLLPRVVGTGRAMDLLMSGRVFGAAEALEMGLVSRLFPKEDLLAETRKYALDLAQNCSPRALASIKEQVYAASETSLELARATAVNMWLDRHREYPDFAEGIRSFIEKRPPAFLPYSRA